MERIMLCALEILPILVGMLVGAYLAHQRTRFRTLLRCGCGAIGLLGHFVVVGVTARHGQYALNVVDRLVVLVSVFLLAHVQVWRHTWSTRRRADDGPTAGGVPTTKLPVPVSWTDDQRCAKANRADKTEIASLLHDTVGQGLTLISMQARSAARTTSVQELSVIDEAATRAMAELREVLGYLHRSGHRSAGIFDDSVVDVVNRFRAAGLAVDFVVHGPEGGIPDDLRSVLVRVAREALSNSVKHDAHATVSVELFVSPGPRMVVRTRSGSIAGRARGERRGAAGSGKSGHGTRMMHRLVTNHGGSLRTSGGNGSFRVEVVFPVTRPTPQEAATG